MKRKLIAATLVTASQLFAALAIADNGQSNSPEKGVEKSSRLKLGIYLPSELTHGLGAKAKDSGSSPPAVLPPAGL